MPGPRLLFQHKIPILPPQNDWNRVPTNPIWPISGGFVADCSLTKRFLPIVSRLERFWAVWSDNEQFLPRDRRDWGLSPWPWPGTGAGLGTGSSGACWDWALSPSLVHGTASPQSRTLCGLVVDRVVGIEKRSSHMKYDSLTDVRSCQYLVCWCVSTANRGRLRVHSPNVWSLY